MPVFHCSSVIWNTSSPTAAPAMLTKASIRPKRSNVFFTTTSAAVGAIKSSSSTSGSAPIALTCWPTSLSFSPLRAARTIAPKSRARRRAVAFPIPELAPVTIATDFDIYFSGGSKSGRGQASDVPRSIERAPGAVSRRSFQKITDAFSDLAGMRFQGEVAGVEKADNRARIVPLERLGAGRHEERVVLAPHRQKWRLVGAEVFLE